jgi:hypothetical protein
MADPFISRDDLSDYLGRDVTDDDGALIAVDSACETVRTLTEQDFNPVIGDEIDLDGSGTDTILLPQLPVSNAGTVVANGETLDGTIDFTFTEDGHLIRTSGTALWSTWSQGYSPIAYWPQGRRNITVTYDHGFQTAGEIDVPSDIRKVALDLAYRNITQGNLKGETIGQVTKTYSVGPTDLSANEMRIVQKYRTRR